MRCHESPPGYFNFTLDSRLFVSHINKMSLHRYAQTDKQFHQHSQPVSELDTCPHESLFQSEIQGLIAEILSPKGTLLELKTG